MSGFEDVIGYETIKSDLRRYCDILRNPERFRNLGVSLPRGLLLYGDAGLGKTTMAKAVIQESGLESFVIRKNKPDGEFVRDMMKTFEEARGRNKPVIVFLDDMDKFANEDFEHPNAEEYVAVQSEIDNCAGHDVFVIATANEIQNFPESLLRAGRFDKIIQIDVPVGSDSAAIIRYYLEKKQIMDDVDIELIERLMEGRSCAELETTINEAGIFAGHAGRDRICDEDFLNACFSCFYGEAPMPGIMEVGIIPEKREHNPFIRDVAVHETGHAVVAEVLDRGSVNAVSIVPSGNGLAGVTSIRKPLGYRFSKDLWENDAVQTLGGKAAVEVVLGKFDLGASSDVSMVNSIVNRIIPSVVKLDVTRFIQPSETNRCRHETMVEANIESYYQKACRIIADNRELFDAVYAELMEKKTLTYRDIARIRESLAA